VARVTEAGVIQPDIEVPVAPDVSGEIVDLRVVEGQRVQKGDLLFTVRPDNYQAAFEQATAALNTARADEANARASVLQALVTYRQDSVNYERFKKLFDQKAIAPAEFEPYALRLQTSKTAIESARQAQQAAGFRVKSAEASVKQSKDNLTRTQVYAAMSGTITYLNAQIGQRVVGTGMMSGSEIIKIADLSRMEVEVLINENDIVNIQVGDTASVEVDAYGDHRFRATVSEIAYSAEKSALTATDQVTTYKVKVLLEPASSTANPALAAKLKPGQNLFRPGMSAQVSIFTERAEQVVSVPIQAVTLDRAVKDTLKDAAAKIPQVVFVYEPKGEKGVVKSRRVETGIADDNYIEVKTGLKAGERIVTGPYTTLTKILVDGMEVSESKPDGKASKK
jgi:HlyD family secretion protein